MSGNVDINQLESLQDLKNTLFRFRNEVTQSLNQTSDILRRITNELRNRMRAEQTKLDQLLKRKHNGRLALGAEIARVKSRLDRMRKYLVEVEKAVSKYQRTKTRTQKYIQSDMLRGQIFLQRRIIEVAKYLRISVE